MCPTVAELLAELTIVLDEERAAVGRLDVAAVVAAAERKERIVNELAARDKRELLAVKTELAEVRKRLLHNGMMLAHARDCIRDLLDVLGPIAGRKLSAEV